ncbi:hypothetical protein [Sedimentibacter sp.]|nr:hypothetical protein [Sedimentibacter sp.]
MVKTFSSANFTVNKQCKFSSSVSKNGISSVYGRSVSIFSMKTANV